VAVPGIKHTSPGSNFYLYLDSNVRCAYHPVTELDTEDWRKVGSSKSNSLLLKAQLTSDKGNPIKVLIAGTASTSIDANIIVNLLPPQLSSVSQIKRTFASDVGMATLHAASLAQEKRSVYRRVRAGTDLAVRREVESGEGDYRYPVEYPADFNIEIVQNA